MNFAFQAFLLFLFFFPGLLFVLAASGRITQNREVPILSSSITGPTALALLFAGLLHFLWGVAIAFMAESPHIPFQSSASHFFTLLSGSPITPKFEKAEHYIEDSLCYMAGYFLSICLSALLAGYLVNVLIEKKRLYRKWKSLRFKPRWHYLLSGGLAKRTAKGMSVYTDILTEVEGKTLLYSGFIGDYWFNEETSELDVLLLEEAWRLSLRVHPANTGIGTETETDIDQEPFEADSTEIPGDTLAIKYSEVKNINIQYVSIETAIEDTDAMMIEPAV